MIVVTLIVAAIITGISNIQSEKGFARFVIKTSFYYMSTSLIAILTGLIFVDRPLDMCCTAINVWGDACGAAIIASTEGEKVFEPNNY